MADGYYDDQEKELKPEKVLLEFLGELIDPKYVKQVSISDEYNEDTQEMEYFITFNRNTFEDSTLHNFSFSFPSEENRAFHYSKLKEKMKKLKDYGYWIIIV